MQKIYFFVQLALCFCTVFPKLSQSQDCTTLSATCKTYESRCAATGSISVLATGGSGSYKYKTTGPVNSNFTTSDSLTGLSAGVYTVIINDLVSNCNFELNNVVVGGSYLDPRFTLTAVHVSCDNGSNGSITVNGQQFGRSPFVYSIVAPSPMGVGTISNSGEFKNLSAGDYTIRMTDSCGGIQTRSITIDNYTWFIQSDAFNKVSCDSASGFVKVMDSRGNVSTLGPIPGFMYGVVRDPGDTIWSSNPNFKFYLAGQLFVDVIAKDSCGTIKKYWSTLEFSASVGATVSISNKTCNSFSATLTSLTNFFNADFCLLDSNNIQIRCNTTGIFNNIPYGSYCIRAHELCMDTIITRCFTASPPPVSIGNNVNIYNKNCNSFSAAVTGQAGLTNPVYCLFDTANTEIICNTTGVFNNLLYGSYCIKTKDSCRDTTIIRCFTVLKPRPVIPAVITPSYIDCNNITIIVSGDSLFSPQYCLYDTSGVLVMCNNTGIFDSLSVGNLCVKVYDSCYDTTITRCFSVGAAVIVNDLTVAFSNKNCSTFTVKANSINLTSSQYCLYTPADSLISCNATGIFNNVTYGAYCIKATNACPDTTFTNCFAISPPTPSVNSSVSISNKTCATFTAKITGQQNLTNPQYCIFDVNNVQISCNSTGTFNNLNYGSYCIKIINTCYDTTITRCFSTAPNPLDIIASTSKSCSYGYATVGVSVTGGNLPVNIKIFKPGNSLVFNKNYSTTSISIDSIPGLVLGETYKIIATDNCGIKDTVNIGVTASIATHSATIFSQCPSAAWLNGSGKIQSSTNTNMGVFTVRVIKKDGATLSPEIVPNSVVGSVFTFNDLGTGTYIISYKLNDLCTRYLYDTVVIAPYYYPNLNRSSAYQCDVNGFSVGAVATHGVGPFSYEIIGSTPSAPLIVAGPQASPIFNIDNGTNYSLIRLRALDACGNATLGDASILPMANFEIEVDSNCFQSSSTLSVDTIYNSTYAWFKKENYNSSDSIYLGSGSKVFIPFLSASDTGTYICHVTVNTGCIKRLAVFNLNGLCYLILPVKIISFTGKFIDDQVLLNWKTDNETDLQDYVIERKNSYNQFTAVGRVNSGPDSPGSSQYAFVDTKPEAGKNFYRLKLVYMDHTFTYSNTIMLSKSQKGSTIHCYPNPVSNMLMIDFTGSTRHVYKVILLNMLSQGVWETKFITGSNNSTLKIPRPNSIVKGVYVLKCIDMSTNEEYSEKVIFL
ncbi:MAG: hypothetical protein H7Z13_06580 [Ferruginibacter sp.]|nr:hypothetical protein [Ferruginibacter sp.]